MRDYGKVSPHFWTGSTGKKLRECPDSIVVAMYLMTCPHANMLGLYYMPLLYVAHETGLGLEGAKKGLKWACEAGFCSYDEVSEMVWVHEMARFQVAESLKPTDNRCKGIQKDYDSLPANPFLSSFYEKYATAFCMTNRREGKGTLSLSNLAPSKPLVSQEQEQEQEQDKSLSQAPAQNFKEPDDSWKPNIEHLCTILQKSKYSQRVQEILLMDDYEFHLSNFNAHHETNRYLTDNQKHSKFAQWLFEKFEKQETQNAKRTKPANPTQSQGGSVNQAFDQQQPDYDENVQPVKLGGNFV
ncbi:hypothetical protein MSC38_01120 [Acinetobacter baumannii]|uniref:hypothetical protein n=1 Tax=Acinetobacter baumannii TaxID=470 RepID=UPI0029412D55|nr:hypothetical protein [Acinetobacter baumannii]MDV4226908.1 hypothetical protein [Acinetobacter baumannii]